MLCNAHRRRALAVINLREIHHMARLRMDRHAQWDIREVTASITALACRAAPETSALACGKDRFDEIRSAAGLDRPDAELG